MNTHRKKILCVDDDPDIRDYLQIVLEKEGFEYLGAASGEEGLRACKECHPDLIILDLMMEEVDSGTEFVQKLRLLGSDTPIFMLSSVGDNLSITADPATLGLAGIFQKPLQRERLLQVLRMALAR